MRTGRALLAGALLAAAVAGGVLLSHQPRASASATCGTERWTVKTLADARAKRIDFTPRASSVSALRSLTATNSSARATGAESRTYRLSVRLVETKREDDQDFHVVVADPKHSSRTMIVEFPASHCTTHSLKRTQMSQARAAFARSCGQPFTSSFHFLRGTATITGVGFFDFNHGQTGVAPNAMELHPVLSFRAQSCAPSKPWGTWAKYRPPRGDD